MNGPKKQKAKITTRITRPTTASLFSMKTRAMRRQMLPVEPASPPSGAEVPPCGAKGPGGARSIPCMATALDVPERRLPTAGSPRPSLMAGIADPRIGDGVQDVCKERTADGQHRRHDGRTDDDWDVGVDCGRRREKPHAR